MIPIYLQYRANRIFYCLSSVIHIKNPVLLNKLKRIPTFLQHIEKSFFHLFWLTISTSNCCNNYMTSFCAIPINHCFFSFLQQFIKLVDLVKQLIYWPYSTIIVTQSTSTSHQMHNWCYSSTLSSLIFMSFISSGNLSTAPIVPLVFLSPIEGTTLIEAIHFNRKSPPFNLS